MARPRVGLALGSGSARGWAHIGVLRALSAARIEADVVCGTSIGAIVGGAYVAGELDALESWARSISLLDIVGLMDVTLVRGSVIAGGKIFKGLGDLLTDTRIENLPKPFAAVATELASGREVWLQKGSLLDAVRASTALPGIFPPLKVGGEWLVDGGLVNPVPVSVCRALGADLVIAVNLNADLTDRLQAARVRRRLRGRRPRRPRPLPRKQPARLRKLSERLLAEFRGTTSFLGTHAARGKQRAPGFFEILAGAIYIMQDRITRSRLADDPPDVLLEPHLSHIRLLDFDRSAEAIDAGRACVTPMLDALRQALAATPAQQLAQVES